MVDSRNLISGKRKYLLVSITLLFIAVISVAFCLADVSDFDLARREVLLRRVGHEVLLQSGDSTSRVLPVKKISADEYQISFENKLTFQPALMVNTASRLLANDPISKDFVVNVFNQGTNDVVYGFAISKNKQDDIVSCKGRNQPRANYVIDVKFKPTGITVIKNGYVLAGFPFLAFVGFVLFRSVKLKNTITNAPADEILTLGAVAFDTRNRKLIIDGQATDLTGTETRLLRIFAISPNCTIERNRLQKEIWEDEGVIVGRSLDMFISKLRKKLDPDPNINIVVVRGKGYKLEVSV
ncbi:winged helix-turn-helix domain-containing protein [Mucilaginibacter roseus]|uniref:Winged helix-turn-helix domain-containing protein n=1 Tax=Mucilaginibacter roseus TaxID=1528868 RepID=A0ABS8U817_9SPHI|nr:winged helix family transcriptional regulator [Mucilaginibacter roseus]MCD8742094.1 winged helix-turn-helix domain-containing protein [Mucilaginibacter roseus]